MAVTSFLDIKDIEKILLHRKKFNWLTKVELFDIFNKNKYYVSLYNSNDMG